MPFAKCIAAGDVLFCVPKENQKSTRYFRGAGGTNYGLLAPNNPKAVGLHTKNPSRFARGFFVFRRFRVACATRCADKLVHFLLRECSRRESAAVDAVYHYDLPCEKANQENPQIFLVCQI